MKMVRKGKRSRILAWAVLVPAAAILLSSFLGCALGLPTGDTGSMQIPLPRGIVAKAEGKSLSYDVYIYKDNKLFRGPIAGKLTYVEDGVPEWQGSVKVDGLPAGGGYRAVILLEMESEGPEFETIIENAFTMTEPLRIQPGSPKKVYFGDDDYVNYKKLGFSSNQGESVETDRSVKNVLASGYETFALIDEELFDIYETSLHGYQDFLKPTSAMTGKSVNSLSLGYDYDLDERIVLINTNDGIWDSYGEPIFEIIGLSNDILKSSSYGYFAVCLTVNSLIYGGGQFLKEIKLGDGLKILDMFVYSPYGEGYSVYLATKSHGAFVLTEKFFEFLEDYPLDPDDPNYPDGQLTLVEYLKDPSKFEELLYEEEDEVPIYPFSENPQWGPSKPRILSFAWNPEDPDSELYIGTDRGIYVAEEFGLQGLEGLVEFEQDTQGLPIAKIATSYFTNFEDFETRGFAIHTSPGIIIGDEDIDDDDEEDDDIYHLPFLDLIVGQVSDVGLLYADLPEGPTGAAERAVWHYLVAGEKGLVVIWEDED